MGAAVTGRRIASIWLPRLAIERWWRGREKALDAPPDDAPVVLATEGPHGPVIYATARGAELTGARIGQRVVDARAAAPDLIVAWADPAGDAAALERLALWARRWGPHVVPDADGLVVDVTGAAHLFGGEAALLVDMETRMATAGLSCRPAVAPTRGAAWALARHGAVRTICHDLSALDPLPVAALRLAPGDAATLSRLGLKTVGALRRTPRDAVLRRFSAGEHPLHRLDQALGHRPEPISPLGASEPLRAVVRLAEPMEDPTPLLPDLVRALVAQMARRNLGARALRLTVCRVDGETRDVEVRLGRPSRETGHLARLFEDRLEAIDPGLGFDAVVLEAQGADLAAGQPDLAGEVDEGTALAQLIDLLAARLSHVARPVARDSHIPERAQTFVPALREMRETRAPLHCSTSRPPRLLEAPEEVKVLYPLPDGPPARFHWRGQALEIARFAGPERIAPEWWVDRSGTRLRDYWRAEDASGRRFWLYREGAWGDGRGARDENGTVCQAPPRWWLQGFSG